MYKICRRLFLVIFIFKKKYKFYKFYRFCRIPFGKTQLYSNIFIWESPPTANMFLKNYKPGKVFNTISYFLKLVTNKVHICSVNVSLVTRHHFTVVPSIGHRLLRTEFKFDRLELIIECKEYVLFFISELFFRGSFPRHRDFVVHKFSDDKSLNRVQAVNVTIDPCMITSRLTFACNLV